MLPDRVSNPGPLTCESGTLPTALRVPALLAEYLNKSTASRAIYARSSVIFPHRMAFVRGRVMQKAGPKLNLIKKNWGKGRGVTLKLRELSSK